MLMNNPIAHIILCDTCMGLMIVQNEFFQLDFESILLHFNNLSVILRLISKYCYALYVLMTNKTLIFINIYKETKPLLIFTV